MKKHWTQFLQDGRYIFRHEAFRQECLNLEIERLENELKRLKKQRQINEELIFQEARKQWTIEEITNAKQEARCTTI